MEASAESTSLTTKIQRPIPELNSVTVLHKPLYLVNLVTNILPEYIEHLLERLQQFFLEVRKCAKIIYIKLAVDP